MDDTPDLARLFNSLDRSAWLELALVVGAAFLLIRAEQRLLPWLANRLHGRARHYLLASVPLLRLLILLVAILLAVPIVIEPSLRNMVALLGAAGLAIGFALKDYASSLIAGVGSPPSSSPTAPATGSSSTATMARSCMSACAPWPWSPRLRLRHPRPPQAVGLAVRNGNNGSPVLQCSAPSR